MQEQEFYSNGKLLITGEYTVLNGATALALPTRQGQFLQIKQGTGRNITWHAFDNNKSLWYNDTFTFDDILNKKQNSLSKERDTLIAILNEADKLNPAILQNSTGFTVTTSLTFPKEWGLGTSSTLINNVAQWFAIDAFELLNNSFGGSGYDIACAQHNTPVLYTLQNNKPIVAPVSFNPAFADNLFFVYLNKKQNSREAIAAYRQKQNSLDSVITTINALTQQILNAATLAGFCHAIDAHEATMSRVLEIPTVKSVLFPDFKGCLKSLGAWGGDFILATSDENPKTYFKGKGYDVIVPYREMILDTY